MDETSKATERAGRLPNGLWLIAAAGADLVRQQGLQGAAAADLFRSMGECAQLPAMHPQCLVTRHPETQQPRVPDGFSLSVAVAPEDVNDWLQRRGVSYRWQPQPRAASAQPAREKELPKQHQQDAALLAALAALGLTPETLPATPKGKASAEKQAARKALALWSDEVFRKAWARMRAAQSAPKR